MKKKILSLFLAVVMIVTSITVWPNQKDVQAATETTEYKELTFSDWGIDDQKVSSGTVRHSKTPITSWDKVAINGTMTMPPTLNTNSYVFIGKTTGTWSGFKLRFGTTGSFVLNGNTLGTVVADSAGGTSNNASITPSELGYTDNLYGQSVGFRLTFEYTDNNANILATLTATGKDGVQKTVWIKYAKPDTEYFDMLVCGDGGAIAIASESIQTDKETYISGRESIQITAKSTSGDWVGVFDESTTTYTKETAKYSYDVASYNGTAYSVPTWKKGNYTIRLMKAESIVLLSKTITVSDNPYTELTFSDWGLDNQTLSSGTKRNSKTPITSWDKVAINGTITMPPTLNTNSYVFIGNTSGVWKGLKLRFGASGQFLLNGMDFGTVVANSDGSTSNNAPITPATLGYTDNLYSKSIGFRLTFEYTDNNENILVTLTATGKDDIQATVWIKFKKQNTEYFEMLVDGSGGAISIASESIQTDKETYIGGRESIQITTSSASGDWVGVFDENAASCTKESAKYSYDVANYNGTAYRIPSLEVGNYTICLMTDEGRAILSKKITVGESTYKELTFRDWGLDNQTVNSSTGTQHSTMTPISSWDKVAINGTITLPSNGSTQSYVNFGTTETVWTGVQLRLGASGQFALISNGFGTVADSSDSGSTNAVIAPETLGYTGNLKGQSISIRLTFEYTDNNENIKVTLIATGKDGAQGTAWLKFTSTTVKTNYGMLVYGGGGDITIASTTEEKNVSDVTYNIEEEPYVLIGRDTVTVDGEAKSVGEELTQAGDYTLKTNQNGILTERQVSLYILGDVDLSESTDANETGITLNDSDIAELQAILAGTKTATPAQQKAADLNNDGKLNNTDLKLLQDIVKADNKVAKRQEILDRYYVDSLSFEYIGGDEVMPIAGFYGPKVDYLTKDMFDAIKASGVNLINYYHAGMNYQVNPSAVMKSLKLAEESGIGMFVDDANINPLQYDEDGNVTTAVDSLPLRTEAQVTNVIGRYSYFDSYLGNFLYDEVTVADQENDVITATNSRNYLYYEETSKQLNKNANTFGYLNLPAAVWYKNYGNAGSRYNLSTANIEEYETTIKTIVDDTDVKVLSFDRYLTDVDTVQTSARYMLNLDIIREQAAKAEIPFWAYVPTGGKWTSDSGTAIPTEAEFYWQLNMSLAFGAKGIQYYTLFELDSHDAYLDSLGNGETAGIFDADHTANTDTWYAYAKNANKQISAVDEILMKSNSKGVVVSEGYAKTNTTNIPITDSSTNAETTKSLSALVTCEDIKSGDGVKRVKSISGAANNNYGVLTGVFDYQGKVALYVVNWDTTAEQEVKVEFENLSNYRLIYAEDAETVVDRRVLGSSCTVKLGEGQAVLIVIEEEDLATTTQYFENIAQYRVEKGTTTVNGETYEYYTEAPELDGYVFAGWYSSEEEAGKDYAYATGQTKASSEEESGAVSASKTDGEAWAKYVDESVLSVKGQISTDVTAESETARIRIVTSTNSLIYQDMGFDIETRGKTATAMGTKVFEKIVAKTGNDKLTFNYTPQESFDSHSYYFQTAILKVKAKDYLDEAIIIKPFWTTADGTKVYGVTRTLTVNQGIQANETVSGSVYSLR